VLKLSPDVFRKMSIGEFICAVDGHVLMNGGGKKGVTKNELLEAIEQYGEV